MLALYGERFENMWKNAPRAELVGTWANVLAGFTGEQIKAALTECEKLPYVPTLPGFKALCQAHKPEAAHQLFLPAVAAITPEKQADNRQRIANIKQILAKKMTALT